MNRQAKNDLFFIGVFILAVVVSMYFAVAYDIGTGGTNFNGIANESSGKANFNKTRYNFTVNSTTLTKGENITQINITMPSGFNFTDKSNWTNTSVTAVFSNTSSVLTWSNGTSDDYLLNATTIGLFYFNASADAPGTYNFTVTTITVLRNKSKIVNTTYVGVTINDTVQPSNVSWSANSTQNNSNVTSAYASVSVIEDGTASLTINLVNSSGDEVNTSTTTNSFLTVNFTGHADGFYILNATVNDTAGNTNSTPDTRNFTIDATAPSVSLTCSPTNVHVGDTVTCTCSASDATSGVNSTAYTANPSTSDTGTITTTCTSVDRAGNLATDSATYTVEISTSSPGSTGTSTTTTTTQFYTSTIARTEKEFSEIGTIETSELASGGLKEKQRIRVKINEETHYVGVKKLTLTTATIEIASDPVSIDLEAGEDAKVDVDDDGFYDVYVKLNSITNGKVDMTLQYINEEVPATSTGDGVATTGDIVPDEEDDVADEGGVPMWVWIVIVVVVLVAIGGGVAAKNR